MASKQLAPFAAALFAFLNEKGIEVKEDDIAEFFGLDALPEVKAEKKKSAPRNSRSSKASSEDSDEACEYEITRGDRKGEKCGKKVVAGTKYCNACSKKKGAQGGGAAASSSRSKTTSSASRSRPSSSKKEAPAKKKEVVDVDDEETSISVKALKGHDGYYYLYEGPFKGFVVKDIENEDENGESLPTLVGRQSGDKVVALTAKEKKDAKIKKFFKIEEKDDKILKQDSRRSSNDEEEPAKDTKKDAKKVDDKAAKDTKKEEKADDKAAKDTKKDEKSPVQAKTAKKPLPEEDEDDDEDE